MIKGVGGKTPKYIILLDSPAEDVPTLFFPLLKRAIKYLGLKSEDFYVTYVVKEQGLTESLSNAEKFRLKLFNELGSFSEDSRILILGKIGAELLSKKEFKTLQRNSRRWFTAVFGATFDEWMEKNKKKRKYKKLIDKLDIDELSKLAHQDEYIVQAHKLRWCMLGMSLAMYLSSPALEEVFYDDLKLFVEKEHPGGSWDVQMGLDPIGELKPELCQAISFDVETDNKDLRRVTTANCVGVAALVNDSAGRDSQGDDSGLIKAHIRGFSDRTTRYREYDRSDAKCRGRADRARSPEEDSALIRWLENDRLKVGFNIKYDLHVLRQMGIQVSPPFCDVKILVHLLAEHLPEKDLKTALRRFTPQFPEYDRVVAGEKTKGTAGEGYENIPIEILAKYCEMDCLGTLKLYQELYPKLTAKQKSLFYLESKYLEIIYQMECNGLYIDKRKWHDLYIDVKDKIFRCDQSLRKIKDINWGSKPQVRKILPFLPDVQEETLKKYKDNHPAIPLLMEYNKLTKLHGTYLDQWDQYYCEPVPEEGYMRLTYEFKQDRVKTGRLSATNPPIQTIPKKSAVREMFVSRFGPEGRLLEVDASQLEYRFMAYASQDPVLIEAYRAGSDMHTETSQAFGIDRNKAKTVNFLILFGGSKYRLADELKISVNDADDFMKRLFDRYKGVKKYVDSTKKFVRDHGYVESMFGRVRRLGWGRDRKEQGHLERAGLNTTIQGPAADYVKASILAGWNAILRENNDVQEFVVPVITVHDSIVLDCVSERVAINVFDEFKQWFSVPNTWSKRLFGVEFNIPFSAEGKIGTNYLNLEKIK